MTIYLFKQRLPAEYQEVEYIQSTATSPGDTASSGQYIDTLVTINKNITVEVDMQFTSLAVQSRLFGGLYDSGSSGITFGPYINGSTQWARATANGVGNWQSTNVAANTNRNKFVLDNTRYIIYNSSGTQVYNGTNSSTISNSDTWTIPLLASKDRTQNKVNRHSSAKLYGSRIWDNGVLVRDFVPCFRKLDGEIGLYDLVDGGFYANQGTGTFTKGADITGEKELKNAYIGEVYEYSYDFRNKSSTILTNDGWTVTGSPTFNSNGMSGNGPSVSRSLPTRNTANKITLTHTFDVRSGGSSLFRIGTMSNGSLTNVSGSYTLQGSYRRITIANSATNYNGVNNGTYTLVMTLDLVNDTWEVTTTGLSTQTGTITSTQKATILANMNNILADTYSSNGGYLQSLSVKIE